MPILHRGADKVMEESVKLLDATYRCSKPADFNNACTDVGDLTHLFPVLNFTFQTSQTSGTDYVSPSLRSGKRSKKNLPGI